MKRIRKSPGIGHRHLMVWPLDVWAELVADAKREHVSVAELIRRRAAPPPTTTGIGDLGL